ncbi:MAG TPA: acyl-CoA dehydrogenase family protein [Myxococcales bacterium]|nr:acyl-CoA dehydrogenase family protein [Myxococcales bacterium]
MCEDSSIEGPSPAPALSADAPSGGGISFRLTAEQEELRALAHDFAERELRPIAELWDARDDYPPGLLAKAARLGLTSYSIPHEHGGGGVDSVTAALIAEELFWGCAGLAATLQATMFPVRPLLRFGSEGQRRRYLPLLAREEGALGAIAFTEPHAGSDLAAMRATATRDGGGYVLSGEKAYVTNGGIADVTIVFAKLDGSVSAFLLERGDAGVTAGRKERKLGLRASYTGSILLDGARIPADRLLGNEGQGREIAADFFESSRPQVAAGAVGVARAAFEYATAYAREREAFGKPLLARQVISFKLADMAIRVEAARLLVWRACEAVHRGEPAGVLGSYAKAFAADAALETAVDAVQVLGGAGIMRDHPVEKWLRDAKVFQIVEGTSEIQREIIAGHLRRDG